MAKQNLYLEPKPRYEILDGLRGVAAMMVIIFHLFETYAHGQQHVNHGYLAVDFFFVLSGFVIVSGNDTDWDAYASSLIGKLDAIFKEESLPAGHVKIIVENGKSYTVGNIAGDGKVSLRHTDGKGDNAKVIVNARVETTPQHLDELVKKALAGAN